MLNHGEFLQDFPEGGPRLSALEAECCEGVIGAKKIIKVLSECPGDKSQGLGGLPYEFYKSMTDLFWYVLAGINAKLAAEWEYSQRCEQEMGER